jgi:type I restriction enzyme, R subunit
MSNIGDIGDIERLTQNRVVDVFTNQLQYDYLGHWQDRKGNSNIEETELRKYLTAQGFSEVLISGAILQLKQKANDANLNIYQRNKAVYDILKYGAKVKPAIGSNNVTVHFIDWQHASNNNFAIAEEVTIVGQHEKRPDIILYINGIALGILELKRGINSISEGIRQNITNQHPNFIPHFFSTIQFVLAGNDTEGLRYGTLHTPEKYFLKWKEQSPFPSGVDKLGLEGKGEFGLLDKHLLQLCNKNRFLEIIQDFILYDGGVKKLCRPHQYFGIKTAQDSVAKREGGVIWHTQGSGKSLTMVWLAKWILRTNANARILIITDRDELDKQIANVFLDAGEPIVKANSGKDLMANLAKHSPRVLCSLIHKFGKHDNDNFDAFIRELKANPPKTVGDIFVFVDECHRTQSGKMHKALKAILQNTLFIGFTGTPLMKQHKQTSYEVFGKPIHTYKFDEAVADEVVKDLMYEARDIEQKISSTEKIDIWFEEKTRGLNDFQKSELKKKWGTMQKVLSSKSRIEKIVNDVLLDFSTKPRLRLQVGNAILVASSIYEACKYYELFQLTALKNRVAVITSYNPQTKDITTENTGANTETDKEYIYKVYSNILEKVQARPNKSKAETYEDDCKELFKNEPANLKLIIVVDKLLTGFDAPPCTYLYIDKNMQDHGLFQAICRVNRLDTDDKDFGYIIDYKDLFKKVNKAITDYTSGAFDDFESEDVEGLLKDRLVKGKERLENAREVLDALCEPVPSPKGRLQYIQYFCGDVENADDLKGKEAQRTLLYKQTVAFIRAYANIAGDIADIYTEKEIVAIKKELDFYLNLREEIKIASSEKLDTKQYEADMRHLIDVYIQAEESRKVSPFDDTTLLELIVNTGIANAINELPDGLKSSEDAIAETIENNVRKKIIKEHLIDPAYFDEMSKILDELIKERKRKAIEYQDYMNQMFDLVKKVSKAETANIPNQLKTNAQKVLYNNITIVKKDIDISMVSEPDVEYGINGNNEKVKLALAIDDIVKTKRQDEWRGHIGKENLIKAALIKVMPDVNEMERIFAIIKTQIEY